MDNTVQIRKLATGQISDVPESDAAQLLAHPDHYEMVKPAPEQVGQLEAGIRGAGQGLTFGLSDEAVGGLDAAAQGAGQVLQGNVPSFQGMKDAYQKSVDEERARNKAAEEQNPYTYKGAEFGAGLLLPIGEVGAALKGAKGLSIAQKALLAGKAGAETGAVLGGLTGFGKSAGSGDESAVDAGTRLAEDTLKGGAAGGVFGGALGGLTGAAGGALGKLSEGTGAIGTTAYAVKRGLEGESLNNANDQAAKLYNLMEQHGEETLQAAVKNIMDRMKNIQEQARQNPEILEQAGNDIHDAARELEFKLSQSRSREVQNEGRHLIGTIDDALMGLVNKGERPNSFPQAQGKDLLDLEQRLGDIRSGQKYDTSPARQGLKQMDDLVSSKVDEAIPDYAPVRQDYSSMKQAFSQLGVPENELIQTTPEGFKRLDPDAAKKILNQFRQQAEGGLGGQVAMRNLETSFDLLKKAGVEGVDDMKNEILSKARDYNVAEYIKSGSSLPKPGGIGAFMGRSAAGLGNAGAKMTAPILGAGETAAQKVIPRALGESVARTEGGSKPNPTEDFSRTIYTMNDDQLNGVSQALKQQPNLSYMGDRLENAIKTGNHYMKNALLFSIAQNPEMRKYLNNASPQE